MVFSSTLFLSFFLPLSLVLYVVAPHRFRNVLLVAISLLFYGWGAPRYLPLLMGSCLLDYLIARALWSCADVKRRQLLFAMALVINLGGLLYFKYANFFVGEVNRLGSTLGLSRLTWTNVALPIGISFFTFHKISYVVDVYRRTVQPCRNLVDYCLYISFFPQLIAGPIVRYHEIERFLASRTHSATSFFDGLSRFCVGLGKKIIIADALGPVADGIFALRAEQLSFSWAWMGAVTYAFQIYFDFSGYSDMAIGLARMFGFEFPENFNKPYLSQSITEFWRHWHMSLSRWMRDYLYIPLGGNRVGLARQYVNLWIVFLVSGIWHGASWNFVLWGVFHGFFLVLDRLLLLRLFEQVGSVVSTTVTFIVILFSWVLFRAKDLPTAGAYAHRMLDPFSFWEMPAFVPRGAVITPYASVILMLATLICFVPAFPAVSAAVSNLTSRTSTKNRDLLRFAASAALIIISALSSATSSFSPFIYFQF